MSYPRIVESTTWSFQADSKVAISEAFKVDVFVQENASLNQS